MGLVTAVPLVAYHMLFKADWYLPHFLFIGFWVFGFWAFVVPLYKLYRFKKLYIKVGEAKGKISGRDLVTLIKSDEPKDLAIQSIKKNTGIPTHLAEKLYAATANKIEKNELGQTENINDIFKSREALLNFVNNNDTKEGAVAAMSKDMGKPKILAAKVYEAVASQVNKGNGSNEDKAA